LRIHGRQHLIFDADDTLWENNIYFERAFDDFCAFLAHSRMTPDDVREALDEIEIANNKVHGYGALNFARNLRQCYERLVEREWDAGHVGTIDALAHGILLSPTDLLAGVAETIPLLAEKHELTLFTKGDVAEQSAKIERSGLKPYFAHCGIVKEKNRDAYVELAQSREFDHARTWMIGNSPKSDINPALAAGLRAVYVPHLRTWSLEREEILDAGGRLIVVQRFADLLEIFGA
jgi:putative hydrolase of the HAD superfamily